MPESDFEVNLRQLRRDKLKLIEALGQQAYPNSYTFTHTVPKLRAFDTPENTVEELAAKHIEASIAGRLMAIRVQGKAGFAQLQGGGERLQIYVRKDDVGEQAFALYKLLDLGDHIGVRGYLMRTRTGELTLHAHEVLDQDGKAQPALTFLTKAMLALPDKYHGLEDTELRYRQRYVDLFMNTGHTPAQTPGAPRLDSETQEGAPGTPTSPTQPPVLLGAAAVEGPAVPPVEEAPLNVRDVFVKRAAVLRAIRKFFDDRDYLEVETPMLHTVAGGAAARPFTTHHNALDIPLSLRIAPELFLKRLVVGGFDRVYEINRNFRNEGVSTRHNPEFTMLEFYQAYSNYEDLMNLTEELITLVAQEVNGTTICNFNGEEINLAKWKKLTMLEAIKEFWPSEFGPAPTPEELRDAAAFSSLVSQALRSCNEHCPPAEKPQSERSEYEIRMASFSSALFLLYTDLIHAPLGKHIAMLFEMVAEYKLLQPTIIYDFPLAVSPLSKQKPNDPDWVERFEFYIGGFEVGNAFSELNDPDEQRARFEAQVADKDPESMAEVDEDYVRALSYGLPPTAGEGIGIDRLTMILTGAKSIRDVILFPLMRPTAKSHSAPSADKAAADHNKAQ